MLMPVIAEIVIPLRLKVLFDPIVPIQTMVDNARILFAESGIIFRHASAPERLYIPHLNVLSIGMRGCILSAPPTPTDNPEVWELYEQRNGVLPGEVVIYFVRSIIPFVKGCARHPRGKPGVILASSAGPWTLAHELGHVLGLRHVDNTQQLMYYRTECIQDLPPDLHSAEIAIMRETAIRLTSTLELPFA
jgi:Matrixin